jgi:hypothetical protein
VALMDMPTDRTRWPQHPDNGSVMPFDTEAEAVEYTVRRLAPYCVKLTREPTLPSGLRPDLVIRLKGLKEFRAGMVVPFPEAIRQAASYAEELDVAAFIAPLAGKGATRFEWQVSPIGSGLLVAGHFGVGGLYFAHEKYQDRPCGGLLLTGATVATLQLDGSGVPEVRLHHKAAHLLKFKQAHGSQSWRN